MDYSILIVCLLYTFGSNAAKIPERYADQDNWGGICLTSKVQSPIDICTRCARENDASNLGPLEFDFKNESFIPVVLTYKYEKLKIGFYHLKKNTPSLNLLNREYLLEDIIIHFPAEHKLDGNQYDMELQFLYMEKSYDFVSFAAEDNATAAISVFVNFASNVAGPQFLTDVVNETRILMRHPGGITTATKAIGGVGELLPNDLSYYHYFGSETHTCQEGYNWFVLSNPITISQEQGDGLMDFYEKDGTKLENNARRTQPLNSRKVYYYQATGP